MFVVCLAMRFVVLRRIELKLGRVAGNGPPEVCGQPFEATRPMVRGHPEINLLRKALWQLNLVGISPD